jgi:serine/threonine protein kinase
VTVGAPLAQALAAAHARALVHGDVTPSNVLFTAEGMPLLADLGVARVVGEGQAAVVGTAEYADPAVARGGIAGPASDVWGLAALCHHMLAGSPPHDGSSATEVSGAAATGERAPLGLLAPTAPRALVAAVEAGLVPDPADRPDAAAFAALLRRAHAAARCS